MSTLRRKRQCASLAGMLFLDSTGMTTREDQRREYNEQKELESLRRVFDTLDKDKNNKIDFKELNEMLIRLDYKAKRQEVEDMIWEVDEDCDKCVSWDEFKLMFQRCRTDKVRRNFAPFVLVLRNQ